MKLGAAFLIVAVLAAMMGYAVAQSGYSEPDLYLDALPFGYVFEVDSLGYCSLTLNGKFLISNLDFSVVWDYWLSVLPSVNVTDGYSGVYGIGVTGSVTFMSGKFVAHSVLDVPFWSNLKIVGAGLGGFCPINTVRDDYLGGTMIYYDGDEGCVFNCSLNGDNKPTVYLTMCDIDFRIKNPSVLRNVAAVNLDGWQCGEVRNINSISTSVNLGSHNIGVGISVIAGGFADNKILMNCKAYGFKYVGMKLIATHLTGSRLNAGDISGDAYSIGFQIQYCDEDSFDALHVFSVNYGIHILNWGVEMPITITNAHFESVLHCVLNENFANGKLYLVNPTIESSSLWEGDIANSAKVIVLNPNIKGMSAWEPFDWVGGAGYNSTLP